MDPAAPRRPCPQQRGSARLAGGVRRSTPRGRCCLTTRGSLHPLACQGPLLAARPQPFPPPTGNANPTTPAPMLGTCLPLPAHPTRLSPPLLRRDAYLPGVQALARSLRLVRARYPLLVMYTRTCRRGGRPCWVRDQPGMSMADRRAAAAARAPWPSQSPCPPPHTRHALALQASRGHTIHGLHLHHLLKACAPCRP